MTISTTTEVTKFDWNNYGVFCSVLKLRDLCSERMRAVVESVVFSQGGGWEYGPRRGWLSDRGNYSLV